LVIGSPALKAACNSFDCGEYSLAAEVVAALSARLRNGEDVVATPCFVGDPSSSLPVQLLDLPNLPLPPDDRVLGDGCDPE
jgi:hypothetical protein